MTDKAETRLSIEEFATFVAINIIASSVSKCEFRTFEKNEETKEDEYFLWNYAPNINQNASEFKYEIVSRILFFGSCLVVERSGQLFIADGYSEEQKTLTGNTYTNVSCGDTQFGGTFCAKDVLHFRLHNTGIRQQVAKICYGYTALTNEAVEKYMKSGGQKGVLNIEQLAENNESFEEEYDDLINRKFKKFFDAKSAVLPLYEGYSWDPEKAENRNKADLSDMVSNINDLVKDTIRRVAQIFNIAPALMEGELQDTKQAIKSTMSFAITPLITMMESEINKKRSGLDGFKKGYYTTIDTNKINWHDVFEQSEAIDKLIASGIYSIDEIRRKAGEPELKTEESQKHYITKNYQGIEGGDQNTNQNDVAN